MKLSDKRRQQIYEAVTEVLFKLRIEIAQADSRGKAPTGDALDRLLMKAQDDAAQAAVRAAEGR